MLYRSCVLPVVFNLCCKLSSVNLSCEIFLEGCTTNGKMIIRKVIVVINQRAFICIFLNRFSKWIGYFFFIVRECRYKCTCLSNEALSFIGISKPCKEVLSCLTLLITCCIRGIDLMNLEPPPTSFSLDPSSVFCGTGIIPIFILYNHMH